MSDLGQLPVLHLYSRREAELHLHRHRLRRGFQHGGERWATPLGQLLEDIDQWAQLFIPIAYAIAMWAIFCTFGRLSNFKVVRYDEENRALQMHIFGAGARALELGSQAVIAPTLATLVSGVWNHDRQEI